jgi:hypothetical protein
MVPLRLGLAWCVLCSPFAVGVLAAAQPPQIGVPETKPPAPTSYAFAFDNARWFNVLEWFSEITQTPLCCPFRPAGTFTFVPARAGRGDRRYTLTEIIDIINEAMARQRFVLVRRQALFSIYANDEPFDPSIGKVVSREELFGGGLAKSEPVRFIYRPGNVEVNALVACVKTRLGPAGQAIPDDEANALVLIDTVANLRAVVAKLDNLAALPGTASVSVWCRYCKASAAAEQCKIAVGTPRRPQPTLGQDLSVFADAANVVHVRALAEKVAMARLVLAAADVPRRSLPPTDEPAVLKVYQVPDQQAEAIADALRALYGSLPGVRVSVVGSAQVAGYAPVSLHRHVEALLDGPAPTAMPPRRLPRG